MKARPSLQRLLARSITAAAGANVLAVAIFAVQPTTTVAQVSAQPGVQAVASVGITVGDLDRAVAFYTGVLSFEKVSETESSGDAVEHLSGVFGARCRIARLRIGDEFIELTQYLAPEGRPFPADSRANDRWFQHIAIVVSDMDKAYAHLRTHQVRHASSGPQTLPDWNPNAGGISAFYFKDPEGHVLEVIQFPSGKGDPRWQRQTDRLFLGIDHTAIVVADTDRSIAFYRDTLGLRVAGTSENYGTEQEHLNNVFGARLRITALRAEQGPGIELLEYLAPTDGRPYPTDTRSNDLVNWTTTLVTPMAQSLADRLRSARVSWISPLLVTQPDSATAFVTAAAFRDTDGHALILGQPRQPLAAPGPSTRGE
ncbi:MAG: VOC family protein [Phycisphaerales bacterium]